MVSFQWLQRNVRPEQRRQLIDWRGVPASLRNVASAVVRNPREAEDLVQFYGSPDYQPDGPVVLIVPGQAPIVIAHIRTNNGDPYGLTAMQLRDIAAEMWWALIGEVMADPDQGRFTLDELRDRPQELRWKAIQMNRLGRLLADAQNKILHPEKQPWQAQNLTVIR